MSGLAVDYSYSSPPGSAALSRAGVVGVIRYVYGGRSGKHLTSGEARDLIAHGIGIAVVCESGATRAQTGGYAGGRYDIEHAISAASATIGHPVRMAYLTDDTDSYGAGKVSSVVEYFRGAASYRGRTSVGIYGGYYSVKAVLDAGHASYGWQSLPAWSRGHTTIATGEPRAALYQELRQVTINGASCDTDIIRLRDWGQYPAPVEVKPVPPAPSPPYAGPWIRGAESAFHMV